MIFAVAFSQDGTTRFECAGRIVKWGSPALVPCELVLMVWRRPELVPDPNYDYGTVEVKCRRCKAVNTINLRPRECSRGGKLWYNPLVK